MFFDNMHLLCFSADNLEAAGAMQKALAFVPWPVLHSNLIQKPNAELGHISAWTQRAVSEQRNFHW